MKNKKTIASMYLDEIGVPYVWIEEEGKDMPVVDIATITPEQLKYLSSIDC